MKRTHVLLVSAIVLMMAILACGPTGSPPAATQLQESTSAPVPIVKPTEILTATPAKVDFIIEWSEEFRALSPQEHDLLKDYYPMDTEVTVPELFEPSALVGIRIAEDGHPLVAGYSLLGTEEGLWVVSEKHVLDGGHPEIALYAPQLGIVTLDPDFENPTDSPRVIGFKADFQIPEHWVVATLPVSRTVKGDTVAFPTKTGRWSVGYVVGECISIDDEGNCLFGVSLGEIDVSGWACQSDSGKPTLRFDATTYEITNKVMGYLAAAPSEEILEDMKDAGVKCQQYNDLWCCNFYVAAYSN
ncbi:hypothetical protein JW710_01665 [Candidatus Dojkabacteria bacterium]|nr:hypothetical protein [Candidatus Dojkabacteria bacterium]